MTGTQSGPLPWFGSVDEWMKYWLCPMWARRIDGRTRLWQAEWWTSAEAVYRLTALWRSWEASRLEVDGASTWLLHHLDPQMAVLTAPDGPFAAAGDDARNTTRPGQGLPYLPPPEGLFDLVDHAAHDHTPVELEEAGHE
jgi:hypothetical protein